LRHVVVGSSHAAYFVLKLLRSFDPLGVVAVVERSQETAEVMAKLAQGIPVAGDVLSEATLERAGVKEADTLFALTESDALNAKLCELAKKKYSVPLVAALANNPMNRNLLLESGADYVLDPTSYVEVQASALLSLEKASVVELPGLPGLSLVFARPGTALEEAEKLAELLREATGDGSFVCLALSLAGGPKVKPLESLRPGDLLVVAVPSRSAERVAGAIQKVLSAEREEGKGY